MDAATARTYTRRDLKDESSVRWTDNEIDRAIDKALDEYSAAWPTVASADVAKGATDTLDVSATASYMFALWVEYPTGDVPPSQVRFREERKGYIRITDSSQPVTGETCRVWYAKLRAVGDVEAQHEDIVIEGATAFAALAGAAGAIGAVNVSGWTPKQYQVWAEERLASFRKRLRDLSDQFSWGGTPHVWSSNNL